MDNNITEININDILIKHWIKFDYDLKNCYGYLHPHHLFTIKNSIHYKTLESGNFDLYNILITTTDQKEHSEDLFKELIENFSLDQLEKNKIVLSWSPVVNKFLIEDGCHRITLYAYNQKTETINQKFFKLK